MRFFTRTLSKLVLSVIAVVLTGLAVMFFWPQPMLPELAQGLSPNFEKAQKEFRARITDAFAPPISEDELVSRLTEQGFNTKRANRSASFTRSQFPCQLNWHIHWKARNNVVQQIEAYYRSACL